MRLLFVLDSVVQLLARDVVAGFVEKTTDGRSRFGGFVLAGVLTVKGT